MSIPRSAGHHRLFRFGLHYTERHPRGSQLRRARDCRTIASPAFAEIDHMKQPGMKQLGAGFYWQDLTVGDRFKSWGRTVLEADIASFVNLVGLHEVVFTDREFLREKSVIKRPFAPGALVYSFAEGLLLPTMQGTGMAFLNMELDMKRPCFAGDTIHVEVEVTEVRQTSKGNRGLVRTFNRVLNQDGEEVLTYNPLRMLKGRE